MMVPEPAGWPEIDAAEDSDVATIWTPPRYRRDEVNRAGRILRAAMRGDTGNWTWVDWNEYDQALDIINNWRAAHNFPLNTLQVNLRASSRRIDDAPLVAQRTKRLISIAKKLDQRPTMKLSQMQDIGGCRSVVHSVKQTYEIVKYYINESRMKHDLATYDDYIEKPRDSGYRGVHLVYRYFSDKEATAIYNGLKIEMQLRSQYQHAWATAVETVGTFVDQALKSSLGDTAWLRFFSLMSTVIARRENTPAVPGTPQSGAELISELSETARQLDVANRLRIFSDAMHTVRLPTLSQAHFYLLELAPREGQLNVSAFKRGDFEMATDAYLEAEKKVQNLSGRDAVLVSVDTIAALERAYPNYFADTRVFVALLDQALTGREREIDVPALPV